MGRFGARLHRLTGVEAASLATQQVFFIELAVFTMMVATQDRAAVGEFLQLPQFIDVAIPRGGAELIRRVSAEAQMPVIKHFDGNCHVYVDESADLEMARRITALILLQPALDPQPRLDVRRAVDLRPLHWQHGRFERSQHGAQSVHLRHGSRQ